MNVNNESILFPNQELSQRVTITTTCNNQVKENGGNFCDNIFSHPQVVNISSSHNSSEVHVQLPKEMLDLSVSPRNHVVNIQNEINVSNDCSDIMNYGMTSRPASVDIQQGLHPHSIPVKHINEENLSTSQSSSHIHVATCNDRVSHDIENIPDKTSQFILQERGSPQPLPSLREMLNFSPNMDDEMHRQFLRQAAKVVEQITRVSGSWPGQNMIETYKSLAPSAYWKHILSTSHSEKPQTTETCSPCSNDIKQDFTSINLITKIKSLEESQSEGQLESHGDEIPGQSDQSQQNSPFAINMSSNHGLKLQKLSQNTCSLASQTTSTSLTPNLPVSKPSQPTTVMVHSGIKPELYTEERHLLVQSGLKADNNKKIITQGVPCHRCCKTFSDNRSLQRHMLVHRGFRPYRCTYCPKAFMLNGDLKRHLRIHNGERPFACEVCGRRFTLKGNLMQHFRTHTPEKQFTCTICRKNYAQKDSLHRHVRAHFGEKPYECSTCGKRFSLKGDLSRHILIHSGLKPHACVVCGRKFALKGNLTQHLRTHNREKPSGKIASKGSVVGKHNVASFEAFQNLANVYGIAYGGVQQQTTYSTVSSVSTQLEIPGHSKQAHALSSTKVSTERDENDTLAVNLSTSLSTSHAQTSSSESHFNLAQSSPERGFSFCSECSKTFSTVAKLREHVKMTHEQSKPLGLNMQVCNYCGKEFSLKAELVRHMNSHCVEKPYGCQFCSKTFTLKGNLHQHLTTHRLGKSFFCSMCDKPFGNQRNLKLHMKRHETARANFACTNCGRAFLAKSDHFFHHCKVEERCEAKINYAVSQAGFPTAKNIISSNAENDQLSGLSAFSSTSPLSLSSPVSTYGNTLKSNSQTPETAKSEAMENSQCMISTCSALQSENVTIPTNTPANGLQSFMGPIYRHLYFNSSYQGNQEKDSLSIVVQPSIQDNFNTDIENDQSRLSSATSSV